MSFIPDKCSTSVLNKGFSTVDNGHISHAIYSVTNCSTSREDVLPEVYLFMLSLSLPSFLFETRPVAAAHPLPFTVFIDADANNQFMSFL